MNLYIRSQDKKRLIPNPNLYITTSKDGYSHICDTMIGHIGKYKSEERAIEILNEIQNRIKVPDFQMKECYEKIDLYIKANILSQMGGVYELPEE